MSPFDEHYRSLFGDRWTGLREALLSTRTAVARLNRFAQGSAALPGDATEILPGCYRWTPLERPRGAPPLPYYVMDAASVLAARAVQVAPGDEVLDLCAAPGGKSLILAEALAEEGYLTLNDSSPGRRGRLRAVLDSYLPSSIRDRVSVTGHDASRWGLHHPDRYDRVLLDAPCSSEAHVLADPRAYSTWTPARPKQLALRQGALLAAAIDSAKPGGRIVYSTCALDPRENDGVVAKLLKKRAGRVRLVPAEARVGETTEVGVHILPDATGFGPIYYAVLERAAPKI